MNPMHNASPHTIHNMEDWRRIATLTLQNSPFSPFPPFMKYASLSRDDHKEHKRFMIKAFRCVQRGEWSVK